MTKRITSLFCLVGAAGILLVPFRVHGQSAADRVAAICSGLEARRNTISSSLQDKQSRLNQAVAERTARTSERRAKSDGILQQMRSNADTARTRSLDSIQEKQSSQTGKGTALVYAEAVHAAVAARRAAFDSARQTFRQQVDALQQQRETAITDQLNQLSGAISSADKTATAKCKSRRADLVAIRDEYIATLKSGRLNYNQFRRDKPDTAGQIKAYAEARTEAFKTAVTEFERAMQAARDAYRLTADPATSGDN